jgi:hypothetical protein
VALQQWRVGVVLADALPAANRVSEMMGCATIESVTVGCDDGVDAVPEHGQG